MKNGHLFTKTGRKMRGEIGEAKEVDGTEKWRLFKKWGRKRQGGAGKKIRRKEIARRNWRLPRMFWYKNLRSFSRGFLPFICFNVFFGGTEVREEKECAVRRGWGELLGNECCCEGQKGAFWM